MTRAAQPALPLDVQPLPALRPKGGLLRRADTVLRFLIALSLTATAIRAVPRNFLEILFCAAALLCAFAHAAPRAPRIASATALALALSPLTPWGLAGYAAFPWLLFATGVGATIRWLGHSGDLGAWLLRVHALEQQRRRALIGTGLASSHRSLATLAGDLYEEEGRARHALASVGARPRRAQHWRTLLRRASRIAVATPLLGDVAARAIARGARTIEARCIRRRPDADPPKGSGTLKSR